MACSIAVTGKGGVGKTTLAGLIIRYLKRNAVGPILALDADPDSNLATMLGMPVGTTLGELREDMQKRIKDFPPGMSKENYVEMGLHEIIVESEKVDLISMGRGEGPGCYCYLNHMLRKFADDLVSSYEWIVMDTEAGLEHLSRRTTSQIDHLIVVVADSPLSVDSARRIHEIVHSMDHMCRTEHYVLNGVREDRIGTLIERTRGIGLHYLGHIPYDPALVESLFDGASVHDLPDGPAVNAVEEIMRQIGG